MKLKHIVREVWSDKRGMKHYRFIGSYESVKEVCAAVEESNQIYEGSWFEITNNESGTTDSIKP